MGYRFRYHTPFNKRWYLSEKIDTIIGLSGKSFSMLAEMKSKIKLEECELKEVLYVPNLSKNLMSCSNFFER